MTILRLLKNLWLEFAHFIGKVNSVIILTLVYTFIFGLAALISKIVQLLKPGKASGVWQDKSFEESTLELLSRQF